MGRIRVGLVSGVWVLVLFGAMSGVVLDVPSASGQGGTIYIRADGSIDPPDAPISGFDNVTYTFVDSINDSIVVEKDNIVVDGAGYTLQGSGSGTGISLSDRSNVTVKNTHITEFYCGISLALSGRNMLVYNTLTNNTYGIYLTGSSRNTLSGNNATNNSYGICIQNSNNNNIASNTITDGRLSGIYLYDSSNNTLSGNVVSSSWYGIELWAYGSYGNILSGNVVSLSGVDGIVLNGAHKNTLSGNIVTSNGQYGITLMADNNIIYGNNVVNNSGSFWSSGIYIQFHYNNTVSSNTIENNSRGIFLYGEGENNKIFHNNFINNTDQIYVYGEHSDIWDDGYPSGGNYWSNYTGTDGNSDGIGDTPYVIDVDNQDRYPLMHPWSSLPVHNIKTGLGYATIQEAMDASETLNGHTIFVEAGTYYENVVVDKTLWLIGENRENTIIDGKYAGNVVKIYANEVNITSFTIRNSQLGVVSPLSGINVYHASGSNISHNIIVNNDAGVWLDWSNMGTICDNSVSNNNRYGIYLSESSYSNISRNDITNNDVYGIGTSGWSNNNSISRNNVTSNFYGIGVSGFSNSMSGNIIANHCGYGIWIGGSSNMMTSNTIANNNDGIQLSGSSDNTFYHNNFINNEEQVVAYGPGSNAWDNGFPSGGNYWSDYVGVDVESGLSQDLLGSDGIGDTPYVIDANNRDHYPLMKPYPWGSHDIGVTYIGKIYALEPVPLKTIVASNFVLHFNIFAMNYGAFPEVFSVTVYADNSAICTQESIVLDSRESVILNFTWNTSSFAYGSYTLWVYIPSVAVETEIDDNNFTFGTMTITIPGDFDGDFKVGPADFALLSSAYGSTPNKSKWNPNCDVNDDDKVGPADFAQLSAHYGQHYP